MKEPKFKKGDWCFHQFNLCQVKETEDDRIRSVSDGVVNISGNDLSDECYPLGMDIKLISDTVKWYSKEFHNLKCNSLNHPDLNRELIRRWVGMCENKDKKDKLSALYDALSKFSNAVIHKVQDIRFEEIEGVSVFRR